VVVRVNGDLGKVGDHEDLAPAVASTSDRGERLTDPPAHFAADALIHFVEHERGHRVVLGQNDLERQHQTRQLAAGRRLRQRARFHPDVEPDLEDDVLRALGVGCRAWGESCREPPSRHPERRKDLVDGLREPLRTLRTLRRQSGARACELGRSVLSLPADGPQIEVRRVQKLELACRAVPRGENVGESGPVFLGEPEQRIAPLLYGRQASGVGFDAHGVLAGRLSELFDVGERAIEQLLPIRDGRVEAAQARDQPGRTGETRGVERLLELPRQPAELVGVGQPLRLRLEGLVLAQLRRRPPDFVHHVPQVVGLASYLVVSRLERFLPPLQLAQPVVGVPHRDPLHARIAMGVQDVPLGVGPQQRLRLVLTVEVHQERAEPREHAHGRGAPVDPDPGAAFPRDLPLEDEPTAFRLHPQGDEGR